MYWHLLSGTTVNTLTNNLRFVWAVVGRRPQGTLLGWFASTGSLARMIFPIVSGYVAQYGSIQTLCGGLTTILLVAAVFVMSSREILTLLSS
jgi:MFS transporter, ceroid-lipofuscinosis neuronal protein 7